MALCNPYPHTNTCCSHYKTKYWLLHSQHHYLKTILKTFYTHLHYSCTTHVMCTSQTLTSKASHLSEMNNNHFILSSKARLLLKSSIFSGQWRRTIVSPAAGSLRDVRRMLTQFFHTFPSFSHALTRGRSQQPFLRHRKQKRKGHKERYCSDQGKRSTLCGMLLFLKE